MRNTLYPSIVVKLRLDVRSIVDRIETIGESRNQELKSSMDWNDENTKFKVTKAILALSNVRDGGILIFGAEEKQDKSYDSKGMTISHFQSFDKDHIADHVGKYTSPYATFEVEKIDDSNKRFIVISVDEFAESPVICKKAYYVAGKCQIQEGDICTRTRNTKPQSSKVTSYLDMRDILDLATEKGVRLFVERSTRAGMFKVGGSDEEDKEQFKRQLADFS